MELASLAAITGGIVMTAVSHKSQAPGASPAPLRRASGVHVVLLGPDGCGKTSVIRGVAERLAPAFERVVVEHLRPSLLPRRHSATPATDPHALPPRGLFGSIAKLGAWLADYTLGYVLRVRPQISAGSLVLYDRYLLDALVDARRYRYGGPRWLLEAIWRLAPKPHLVILLDAPEAVLRSRKREVSASETARQRSAYRELVRGIPRGTTVDAAQPLDCVTTQVCDLVLACALGRRRRNG